MRSSKDNFMQIIQSDRYEFKKIIDDILSADQRTDIAYDDIKKLAGSPGIKRALWRSIRIIDEIVDTIGYEPKLISIEMARNEDEKVRTKSRYGQLEKMYKELYGKEYTKSDIKSQLADHKDKINWTRRNITYTSSRTVNVLIQASRLTSKTTSETVRSTTSCRGH